MIQEVLWRRLTETDFNAMNGCAAPSGTGGGAMHISLGINSDAFPIADYLQAGQQGHAEVQTEPQKDLYGAHILKFLSNPNRRSGEWIIQDQFTHRHPAWSGLSRCPR